MAIGWAQFGIYGKVMRMSPQRYTSSMQWQVSPRKLTASRLAQALREDSGGKVSVETASRILKKYPPQKGYTPVGKKRR